MKWIRIIIAMILTASVGIADFLTPLADLPVGTNATGKVTFHEDYLANSKKIMEESNARPIISEASQPARSKPPTVLGIILGSDYIGILGYLSMLALIVFAMVSFVRMAFQPIGIRNPAAFLGFAHIQFLFFLLANGFYALLIPPCCCGPPSLSIMLFWLSTVLAPFYVEFMILLISVFTLCSMSRKWPKPSALTITATFIAVLDFVLLFIIFLLLTLPVEKSM